MDTAPLLASTPLTFVMPEFDSAVLSNGTPVYIVPSTTKDILTITLAMRGGSSRDAVRGETSMTMEMLKQGTQRHSTKDFNEEVESRGCWIRTSVDHDGASIQATGLGEWFEDLAGLMSDCILRPLLEQEELEKLRARIVADLMIDMADVDWLASRAASQGAYDKHPYAHASLGSPASLATLTVGDLHAAHNRLLTAPRWIIVAGPVTRERAMSVLEGAFGAMPASTALADIAPPVKRQGVGVVAGLDDAVQTSFRIIVPALPMGHPDYAAAQLITNVLGGFTLARLFTILREEKGYTYGAYASTLVRSLDAAAVLSTSVGNDFTADTIATIASEVTRLGSEKISDDELDSARRYIVGSFARSCETPQQTAWLVHTLLTYSLPFDFFEHYVRRIQELTADDLIDVQRRLYSTDTWVVGASGVPALVESAIQPYVDVVEPWNRQGY
ncbi:MAG: insulinase family protein [Candidatus Kapabacteria bacterium]|nr:insulinase family protein [Candidatus Kapabacteria bacterium]